MQQPLWVGQGAMGGIAEIRSQSMTNIHPSMMHSKCGHQISRYIRSQVSFHSTESLV